MPTSKAINVKHKHRKTKERLKNKKKASLLKAKKSKT